MRLRHSHSFRRQQYPRCGNHHPLLDLIRLARKKQVLPRPPNKLKISSSGSISKILPKLRNIVTEIGAEKMQKIRKRLNEREIAILDERVAAESPTTLDELGSRFGVTPERIRQIEKKLVEKLKFFRKMGDLPSKIPNDSKNFKKIQDLYSQTVKKPNFNQFKNHLMLVERDILRTASSRFPYNIYTLNQIAEKYGLTPQHAINLRAKLIIKFERFLETGEIPPFSRVRPGLAS